MHLNVYLRPLLQERVPRGSAQRADAWCRYPMPTDAEGSGGSGGVACRSSKTSLCRSVTLLVIAMYDPEKPEPLRGAGQGTAFRAAEKRYQLHKEHVSTGRQVHRQ